MKLKNKRSGEIKEFVLFDGKNELQGGATLKDLVKEWEDVPEEPKVFWYIDDFMIMCGTEGEFTTPDLGSFTKKDIEKLKEIGNYFDTREAAEKAVEKLKAWKRLKDKGFKITNWTYRYDQPRVKDHSYYNFIAICEDGEVYEDLDLLFSGEDD